MSMFFPSISSSDDIILLIDCALDACANKCVMLSFGKRRIQRHGCDEGGDLTKLGFLISAFIKRLLSCNFSSFSLHILHGFSKVSSSGL